MHAAHELKFWQDKLHACFPGITSFLAGLIERTVPALVSFGQNADKAGARDFARLAGNGLRAGVETL